LAFLTRLSEFASDAVGNHGERVNAMISAETTYSHALIEGNHRTLLYFRIVVTTIDHLAGVGSGIVRLAAIGSAPGLVVDFVI
jgi:hypothetical protein